jgi:hypothetical protein
MKISFIFGDARTAGPGPARTDAHPWHQTIGRNSAFAAFPSVVGGPGSDFIGMLTQGAPLVVGFSRRSPKDLLLPGCEASLIPGVSQFATPRAAM